MPRIPAPEDPELRAQWQRGVAARQEAGLSPFVGSDYLTDAAASDPTVRYADLAEVGSWLDVSAATVSTWRGRYDNFPRPDAVIGRTPGWARSRRDEFVRWAADRPGRGAGGGRPRKN